MKPLPRVEWERAMCGIRFLLRRTRGTDRHARALAWADELLDRHPYALEPPA